MLEVIITSSLLIGLLIFMRCLCWNKISRRLQYALWLLAAVRLLMPAFSFENPFSIMNKLYPAADQVEKWTQETEVFSGTEQLAFKTSTGEAEQQYIRENTKSSYEEGQPSEENPENGLPLRKPEAIQEGKAPGSLSVLQLLRNIWFAGMAVMGCWMAAASLLYRLRFFRNRKYLGREGWVRIYAAENADTPCLLGVLCPVIYLTPCSLQDQKIKEYAVNHELTHYRHGDHVWSFVRNLCLMLYWFNPLVWIGTCLAALDCELACDEGVLCRLGEERAQEYGYTLIQMAASFRRPWLLHCETALAPRKRDLKKRIAHIAAGRKNTGIPTIFLVILCGAALAAFTFGKAMVASAMGRYTETDMNLSEISHGKAFPAIAQEEKTIRLIAEAGYDVMSLDNGITFKKLRSEDMPPGTTDLFERNAIEWAGTTGGARVFESVILSSDSSSARWKVTFEHCLITESGEEIRLEISEKNHCRYFYSTGCFYISESGSSANRYYRMDPVTGKMHLLLESEWVFSYMAADDKILYLASEDGVLLYDLETGRTAQQDQALSDFVAENASSPCSEHYPAILYPYRDGVYILTHRGLYWHKLYDKNVEQIIDGAFYTIGDRDRALTGMILRETEGEPEFLILYDRKDLMRYTYDASLPAEPEEWQASDLSQ